MAREIKNSVNFTKKDAINARNGQALQDLPDGTRITVKSAAMLSVADEDTGEVKDVSVLITDDGDCLTSISATVYQIMDDIIDIITDDGVADIRVNQRTSKGNNRKFLTLTIL